VSLYVNGVLDKSATETSASVPNYSSSLNLGLKHTGDTVWFNGTLDDVRLYRRALTFSEVTAMASSGFVPVESPGSTPAATSGVDATLAGGVLNELGGSFSNAWNKVSGPGTVKFGVVPTPGVLPRSATFSQTGTYTLRLSATNAAGETSGDLAVTVTPNPNVYTDWINSYFPGALDPNVVGPQADPDQDSAGNTMEWALDLKPAIPDATAWTAGKAGLPVQAWQNVGGTDYLSLQVRRPVGRIGVTYSGEVSGNLINWNPAVQENPPTTNGDGSETVIFRDTVPRADAARRFIRLKLSQP
jgi:hypothetical protein